MVWNSNSINNSGYLHISRCLHTISKRWQQCHQWLSGGDRDHLHRNLHRGVHHENHRPRLYLSPDCLPQELLEHTGLHNRHDWVSRAFYVFLHLIFQQDEITGLNFNPLNNELIRGLELSLFLYYTSSQYLPSPLHCTDICPHKNKIYLVRYFSYFSRPPSTAPLSWLQYNFLAYKLLGEGVKKFAISRKFCKDYFQLLV